MVNGILAILSNVRGNRQSNEVSNRRRGDEHKADHSKSWDKSRGHKKHCKH
jgi:hypothetical protein